MRKDEQNPENKRRGEGGGVDFTNQPSFGSATDLFKYGSTMN